MSRVLPEGRLVLRGVNSVLIIVSFLWPIVSRPAVLVSTDVMKPRDMVIPPNAIRAMHINETTAVSIYLLRYILK
jgi:hypothetical protein